jgi:hypothetical protein
MLPLVGHKFVQDMNRMPERIFALILGPSDFAALGRNDLSIQLILNRVLLLQSILIRPL